MSTDPDENSLKAALHIASLLYETFIHCRNGVTEDFIIPGSTALDNSSFHLVRFVGATRTIGGMRVNLTITIDQESMKRVIWHTDDDAEMKRAGYWMVLSETCLFPASTPPRFGQPGGSGESILNYDEKILAVACAVGKCIDRSNLITYCPFSERLLDKPSLALSQAGKCIVNKPDMDCVVCRCDTRRQTLCCKNHLCLSCIVSISYTDDRIRCPMCRKNRVRIGPIRFHPSLKTRGTQHSRNNVRWISSRIPGSHDSWSTSSSGDITPTFTGEVHEYEVDEDIREALEYSMNMILGMPLNPDPEDGGEEGEGDDDGDDEDEEFISPGIIIEEPGN